MFTVGEATSKSIGQLGFTCIGEESGNADNLSTVIINDYKSRCAARANQEMSSATDTNNASGQKKDNELPSVYLFLSGDNRRPVLPNHLNSANIPFYELVVYSIQGSSKVFEKSLEECLGELVNSHNNNVNNSNIADNSFAPLKWIVFFSPSGVDSALAVCKSSFTNFSIPWESTRIAAIGKTTQQHLENNEAHLQSVHAVASQPNAKSLCESILQYDRANNRL